MKSTKIYINIRKQTVQWKLTMKNVQISFITLLCILGSCTSSYKQNLTNGDVVLFDLSKIQDHFPISSFISDIHAVELNLPEPYFFGIITEVLFTDSTFFVVDKKQQAVFHFRKDGTFLNRISNRGEAPSEYRNLHRFIMGNQNVFICDLNMRKIHCYTYSGEYVRTISSPFTLVYDDIAALPNGKFLCHDIQGREGESKIWLMNESGEKEKTLLNHDTSYPYSNTDRNTIIHTMSKDSLKIIDPISGAFYLYEVKTERLTEIKRLTSNKKSLVDYPNVENLKDMNDEYAYISYLSDTNKYLYSMWYTSDRMALCSLYEKGTKISSTFYMPEMDFSEYPICPIPVSTNLPNSLVTILTDEYPLEYFPKQFKERISERVAIIYIMEFKI